MNESKLPPPRAESEGQRTCILCGHSGQLNDKGICLGPAPSPISAKPFCCCKCVFPEPSKVEQGVEPCPFCGNAPELKHGYVYCRDTACPLEGDVGFALPRWNTRVTQQSVESVWDEAIRIANDSELKTELLKRLQSAKAKSLAAQNKDQKLG